MAKRQIPVTLLQLQYGSASGLGWVANMPAQKDKVNKHHRQNFFSGKLTISDIRKYVAKMRELEIKPDSNGYFYYNPYTRSWIDPIRDSWLSGKPVGGA